MEQKEEKPVSYIPCFLCGEQVEIRASKRSKPYFICDPCGLQAFIRKDRGIEILARKTTPVMETGNGVLKLLAELERVNSKLREIENNSWFFENQEEELAVQALKSEKQRLERLLRETGKLPGEKKLKK